MYEVPMPLNGKYGAICSTWIKVQDEPLTSPHFHVPQPGLLCQRIVWHLELSLCRSISYGPQIP